jgi:LPS-assembly lipoprotein
MWWSDRRGFLAALGGAGLIAGCGFAPVHAPGGAGGRLARAVRAADPATRADFQFVAALEERLGRPDAAMWDLHYQIAVNRVDGGVLEGLGATRIQLEGQLDFTLSAMADGNPVASGRLSAMTSYSATDTQFATLAAAEDAQARLMRLLADRLVTRLYTEPGLQG